ncbi:pea pathogenicity protein 2 [Arthrobacter sp. Hiyo8]|uniref:nuclear transport factor 2 family protein n=1 Tax=Arthrobacter sp. Hiyo1 TaxID=1588020 RepID=UPI000683847E|nr:nuclear transport factor 2 family protein [Arthrobacter sp. Hiyo1]BAS11998.1 pea pathogenicity protein 2 [Arthrobacter sp. Hiyo8]GAP60617.1 pea pathogenicity protein 2 [Arthrobacter sp. Hiyo1]
MDVQLLEKLRIREVIENWAVWRDAGDWNRFRTVWSPEGEMMATWMQGPAEDFIQASIEAWNKGVSILHFLGGSSIDVAADRAVAQTKMTITQRADVEGVSCDIICTGRFYDFMEKQNGEWKVVLRQPIYEADRIQTVKPGKAPDLDPALLEEFPAGYRHLAYAQSRIGYSVKTDMPGLTGPAVEDLYDRGFRWLKGN